MWINSIFLQIYCMSFPEIALLLVALTVAYFTLKHLLDGKKSWRIAMFVLLLAWFLATVWNTLISRAHVSDFSSSSFIPFYSYYVVFTGGEKELLRENFMNIILFYPAGLLACELLPKSWNRVKRIVLVVCLFALMSLGIEFFQFRFALGQAEVDDIIHNTLGALIGAFICQLNASFSAQSAVK